MPSQFALKPVIWVGSSRRAFRAMPEQVRSHLGYALYVAQQGGRHRDAKPLHGFGGAGVVEIVSDHDGDTFRAVYTVRFGRSGLCAACVSEKVKEGKGNPQAGDGTDRGAPSGSGTDFTRKAMKKKIGHEVGSGNVFADLGLPNAEEHLVKA